MVVRELLQLRRLLDVANGAHQVRAVLIAPRLRRSDDCDRHVGEMRTTASTSTAPGTNTGMRGGEVVVIVHAVFQQSEFGERRPFLRNNGLLLGDADPATAE